jgi:hypothetical protein
MIHILVAGGGGRAQEKEREDNTSSLDIYYSFTNLFPTSKVKKNKQKYIQKFRPQCSCPCRLSEQTYSTCTVISVCFNLDEITVVYY